MLAWCFLSKTAKLMAKMYESMNFALNHKFNLTLTEMKLKDYPT